MPKADRYESAKAFYNDRYSRGYMNDWDAKKKCRVFEIISELHLPKNGCALDFGCGNGIWCEVLRKALPGWKIVGTDISSKALENARKRLPDVQFVEACENANYYGKFDFVFSHHVLEHVFDIQDTFRIFDELLKPVSAMLHILPCGNPLSFEKNLCTLVKDGVDKKTGCLFYEDPSHMRKLDTKQMNKLASTHGFILTSEFYSYHYWAAIEGITSGTPGFILKVTDSKIAKDEKSKVELKFIRNNLLRINLLRLPSLSLYRLRNYHLNYSRPLKLMDLFMLPLLPLSYPTNYYINRKADMEWLLKKKHKNGGEMYLYYSRKSDSQK